MSVSRITEIRDNGSFPSQHGTNGVMFSSVVYFEDNSWGIANHKNSTPPYRVGDEAEYTITGNHQGTPKLKVQRPGSNFAPPARSSAPNPAPRQVQSSQPAREAAGDRVNGASVGMAINQALALLTKDVPREKLTAFFCQEEFWMAVKETASDVIRVARNLEEGHLAPSVRDRNKGNPSPSGAIQQPSRPQPQARNNPPPHGQAFHQTDTPDEDVPY